MPAHPRRAALAAVATILGATLVGSPVALAAGDNDKLDERADTTWRVLPDAHLLHVSTTAELTNKRKPGKWRRVPCKGGKRGVCKQRTRYYFDHWSNVWIPATAVNVAFGPQGVTGAFTEVSGSGSRYTLSFPRIWHKQKQRVTIDYDIPATAAGIGEPTRIEEAYIHLCYYGEAADRGSVKAVLPPGFEPVAHYYGTPAVERTPEGVVLSRPRSDGDPAGFFACTEAIHPERYEYTYLVGDDGRGLVSIEAWPGDAIWAGRMITETETARPWLEQRLGSALPVDSLVIREVSTQGRRRGGADLWPVDGVLGISEASADAGAVSVPLARLWFGSSDVAEPWLAEGLAMWAGHAAIGSTCPQPVVPEGDAPDLSEWVKPGPVDDLPTWDRARYQSAVTCGIVEAAADAIGPDAMTDILAELLASPTPVGVTDWLVEVAVTSDAATVDDLRARIGAAGRAS